MAVSYRLFFTKVADVPGTRSEGIAVTGTNTYYSEVWGASKSDGSSFQLEWTGTPTGTFTLWYSNKMHPDLANDNDWIHDTAFTPTNPAGSAGKMGDNTANSKANLKRVKYVNASGTGTLKGWVTVA